VRRLVALALAITLSACTRGGGSPPSGESPTHSFGLRGGTLHVVSQLPGGTAAGWDPASYVFGTNIELYRCCLLRNLYSYVGRSAEEGGGVARPDLATGYPEVSPDGLTWTIHLRPGIRYAPPYQGLTVTADDVVNGLEHLVVFESEAPRFGGYSPYFSVIEGFDGFAAGHATSIAGLDTPDDLTLLIHLTEPAGDLVDRIAWPPAAPIPARVADAHPTDYVRYLASVGPYMLEGADRLDPSKPLDAQPIPGWSPTRVSLVRNPSWDRSTDALRAAYPDRIELLVMSAADSKVAVRREQARFRRMFLDGRLQWLSVTPRNLRMLRDGTLLGHVETDRTADLWFLEMNLAVPPFDDVHVRRAVNLVLDRSAIEHDAEAAGGLYRPTWHLLPSTLVSFLIADDWRPPWAAKAASDGDLGAARGEMARSRYDVDGDGRCDGPACRARAVAYADFPSGGRIARALRGLGLVLDVRREPVGSLPGVVTPRKQIGAFLQLEWLADFSNASTFFLPLLYGPSIRAEGNYANSLLGVGPSQLRRWGYRVLPVPSADARIERCAALVGEQQQHCWATLDLYITQEIVPWAPLLEYEFSRIVSEDVASYDFDAAVGLPAYDRIALAPGTT
jgi:peptide/nickel transport system substrate-binding protein